VIVRFLGSLDQFVDDMLWGCQIGVSHAEVDDIFSGAPPFHLQSIDLGKNIGWQSIHAAVSSNIELHFPLHGY